MLVTMVVGCQTYERRPVDTSAHLASFFSRSAEGEDVRAFAAGLAAREGDATGFGLDDGVSCAEAEIIALVYNAELRLARLRAGVALATAENAGRWDDPAIGVDLAHVIGSALEPWKVFASVGLTIPLSGRLEVEKQRAGAEHAAELARVAQQEWTVRMAVRRAWCEWTARVEQVAVTRDTLARADQILAVVDAMERAGEMARIEARLLRIERATIALEVGVLESQAREADLLLRRHMGMSPDAPIVFLATGIGPARRGMPRFAPHSGEATGLERRNPAVRVALAEYEVAERALELEIRRQYPDIHIGPGYGREDGQDQVLFSLSVPVPILNANRQRIAERRAGREAARAAVEVTLEHSVAALRAAEVRLSAATQRRLALETEIVPLVDAQSSDARNLARLGEVNTLVLLQSLIRQHEAKTGLILAARDESLAAVDRDELLGPETVDPPSVAGVLAPSPIPPAPSPRSAPPLNNVDARFP